MLVNKETWGSKKLKGNPNLKLFASQSNVFVKASGTG
jgi:hypothetical protein